MIRAYDQYSEDLANLTGLPLRIVRKLMKMFRLIIGHEIYECILEDSPKYESYAMGLGKLEIKYNPDTDDYDASIRLSKDMKIMLDKVLNEQKSPLDEELSKWLVSQLEEKMRSVIEDDE